ncbi:MAG: hypothetical protein M1281_00950 [Chloroflexi bacterium]|nr:hypothetical protein [Chloroflexota bacterium]
MIFNAHTNEARKDLVRHLSHLPRLFAQRGFFIYNILLALVLAVSGLAVFPAKSPASAATLTVTSTADSGAGSLRQAIADAAAGDTITFNLAAPATITLTTPITVGKDLIITGPGTASLFISGGNATQILRVAAGTLRISQLTILNGRMAGQNASGSIPGTIAGIGGAIYIGSGAGMTASNVNFTANAATGGTGGNSVNNGGFYGGGGGGIGGAGSEPGGFAGGGGGGYAMYAGGNGGFGGGGGGLHRAGRRSGRRWAGRQRRRRVVGSRLFRWRWGSCPGRGYLYCRERRIGCAGCNFQRQQRPGRQWGLC